MLATSRPSRLLFRVSVPKQTVLLFHHQSPTFQIRLFLLARHLALRHLVVFGPSPPASALGLSLIHRRYYIQKWLAACRTSEPTVKVRASVSPMMKNNPRKVRGGPFLGSEPKFKGCQPRTQRSASEAYTVSQRKLA